jgi:hypothetical protein
LQLRFLERWISIVRLLALPFIVGAIAIAAYPPGRWEPWAWLTTAAFAIGSAGFFVPPVPAWETGTRSGKASPPRSSTP